MADLLRSWAAQVPNLAEHADNPVHTDEGGRAAGYEAAIVAGTTVYALMTHVPAAAWGLDWIARGGSEVRFRAPVLADQTIDFVPTQTESGSNVVARAGDDVRATCDLWLDADRTKPRDGESLEVLSGSLASWGSYGMRSGDDLAIYADRGIAHPAAWPCIANRLFSDQLVNGSWVHVRSRITHLDLAPIDAHISTNARVINRFETRGGRRAVVDCLIEANGRPVALVEHEALVELF
jgi:acyl dehydratase